MKRRQYINILLVLVVILVAYFSFTRLLLNQPMQIKDSQENTDVEVNKSAKDGNLLRDELVKDAKTLNKQELIKCEEPKTERSPIKK